MKITKTYTKDFNAPPKERNVFILMDGTWNDENEGDLITNIVKLHKCLGEDSDTQISRYFRGVGNDDDNGRIGVFLGGAFGKKEKKIRDHAYSTIVKEYHPGDRIFIFGFSRGAASARMLASQLQKMGIPEIITITSKAKENRTTKNIENKFEEFEGRGKKQEAEVTLLGVWDTVGAFGIPVNLMGIPFQKWNLFKDMHVAKNVKKAVHLVSIDETRSAFRPTLMNRKKGVVEEIWFAGVHSDVGGSYAEDELAKITLGYMVEKIKDLTVNNGGSNVIFKQDELDKYVGQNINRSTFHFHGLGYKKSIRKIYVLDEDEPSSELKPKIHDSVFRIQESKETYSLVIKKKLLGKNKENLYRIQYNPPNVKDLKGKYQIDG